MMNEGYSLSDIAAATGNGACGGKSGWGEDGGAWWIILFLIFAAWGGNGLGNGFGGQGGAQGALTRGDLCMDMNFSNVDNNIRSGFAEMNSNFRAVDNAVCQLGYQNAQLINGVDMSLATGFGNLNTNLCQVTNNIAQGQNALASQLAGCCCDIREAISGVNYNMAMNSNAVQGAIRDGFCQTNYNAATNTRDIIEAQNANTRAILDKLTQQEIAAKDAQIAAQNQRLFAAELTASQATQTQTLVDRLRPCPSPAYITCNPWATQAGYGSCGCAG